MICEDRTIYTVYYSSNFIVDKHSRYQQFKEGSRQLTVDKACIGSFEGAPFHNMTHIGSCSWTTTTSKVYKESYALEITVCNLSSFYQLHLTC